MASCFEKPGNGQSDNTARQQTDRASGQNFDAHGLLGEAAQLQINSKSGSADKYLPACTIHDAHEQPAKPGAQAADNRIANPNELNGTKIGRDGSGNATSYQANGYSVTQHQDGKWYYHQDNKDGSKFLQVNNVQMDSNGKVTFHETGPFAKNGSIGGGEAPHEDPTSALGKLQSISEQATHTVLGDSGANALGNSLVDIAHTGNTAIDETAIQLDRIPTYFENKDGKLTPAGQTVMDDVSELQLNARDLVDGANIQLSNPADRGAFYNEWKNLQGAVVADSSHDGAAGSPQYRIPMGPGDSCVLFGIGKDGNTFFQLERHNFGNNLLEYLTHGADFLTYKITDSSVGPAGISPRTYDRPIIG